MGTKKNLGGRPKCVIDYNDVEKLAGLHCTQQEIASYVGVSVRTLQRDKRFCRIYKNAWNKGKISLRRAQFEKAIKFKDTTMQIWLGKTILGQHETVHNVQMREPNILLTNDEQKYFEDILSADSRIRREA